MTLREWEWQMAATLPDECPEGRTVRVLTRPDGKRVRAVVVREGRTGEVTFSPVEHKRPGGTPCEP